MQPLVSKVKINEGFRRLSMKDYQLFVSNVADMDIIVKHVAVTQMMGILQVTIQIANTNKEPRRLNHKKIEGRKLITLNRLGHG